MVALDIHSPPASGGLTPSEESERELYQYSSLDETFSYSNQSEPLLSSHSSRNRNNKYSTTSHPHGLPPRSIIARTLGWSWSLVDNCYNRISAWLFPNEPEPLDLQSTIFFISQAPVIFLVILIWIPTFIAWMLGIRTSQAGGCGKGQGMRKDWSYSLAFALSFLKTYLYYGKHLTIEECQNRSRSIPFMTAPSGTRVNKVKIPAFPYRPRAEAVLYDCLSEKEREILSIRRENNNNNYNTNTPEFEQARKEGNHLSVRIQQNAETVQPHEAQFKQNAHLSDDKFAEGLDAEWLEYVGSDEIGAEKPNRNNVGAILYLHGGGYYTGSKEEHRVMIGPLVKRLGKHIRVLTVNYRLAPQHPFPAALVDALSSYMWLLDQSISESFSLSDCNPEDKLNDKFQPNQIIFMGDSAGGGLALSLSLLIRDHGSLPQPLSIVTWSPWLDLTQSLPSFNENATTDCIPYEEYIHRHSEAVNKMFEQQEIDGDMDENNDTKPRIRQRAQVYCPDTYLRMKYVSPIFETDYSGIPSVFITCGSAERFTNECILMAARLEEQQQPCRIDIHEDMPHVFPLFRFHPSAIAALDRTCNYIREVIRTSHAEADKDDVLIPISSTSSSSSSSRSSSPLLPSGRFEQTAGSQIFEFGEPLEGSGATRDYAKRPNGFHRTDSLSSISSVASEESVSAISVTSPSLISRVFSKGKQALLPSVYGKLAGKDTPDSPTDASQAVGNPIKRAVKIRTTVNVVDLSGYSVTSYHKRNRYGRCDNTSSQRRRHRRSRLKLRDVVSDATLYEWEILLKQDYIPTRHWPLPPSSRK